MRLLSCGIQDETLSGVDDLNTFQPPTFSANGSRPGPLLGKFYRIGHVAFNQRPGFFIHSLIEQIGGEQDGNKILAILAPCSSNLQSANGNAFQLIDMPLFLHPNKMSLIFGSQLGAEKMTVGGQISTHPPGLDLEKNIRGHLKEM